MTIVCIYMYILYILYSVYICTYCIHVYYLKRCNYKSNFRAKSTTTTSHKAQNKKFYFRFIHSKLKNLLNIIAIHKKHTHIFKYKYIYNDSFINTLKPKTKSQSTKKLIKIAITHKDFAKQNINTARPDVVFLTSFIQSFLVQLCAHLSNYIQFYI